jgi:TRAP-type C4-dicarboxylate transport system permease small subunit
MRMTDKLYRILMVGAAISMVGAFLCVGVGVLAREAAWNIQGLDAYAGYAIAAALFLALPATLKNGDHIRVTLLVSRLPERMRRVIETACLAAAILLSGYLAYFSCRLVWVSYTTHDVSQAVDATPLWIPQIVMALGTIGLLIAFIDAAVHHARGRSFMPIDKASALTE